MYSRRRETLPILSGALVLYLTVFFLAIGCDSFPTNGGVCPPTGSIETTQQQTAPESVQLPRQGEAVDSWNDFICVVFPSLCYYRSSSPFLDPLYYWGGDSFDLTEEEALACADWHNAFLDYIKNLDKKPSAGQLMDALSHLASEHGLILDPDPELRGIYKAVFQDALSGSLTAKELPRVKDLLYGWDKRPLDGPFNKHPELRQCFTDLEDGVDETDVEQFRELAMACLKDGKVREVWASATMAASVQWWSEYEAGHEAFASIGVAADLTALTNGGNHQAMIVASATGLIIDLVKFFWGD